MYIYFDKNGTIKEVINDESIRRGSNDYNKIYCYLEGNPVIDDIWYLQKNPDGTLTNEVSFVDNIVTKTIPYDSKRDMKYFQDFEEYKFYVFTLSSSYLSQNGLVVATIRVAENNTLWALGELTFNVQANIVNSDNDITQSQYDYLLLTISSYYSKSEIDNKFAKKDGSNVDTFKANDFILDGVSLKDNLFYYSDNIDITNTLTLTNHYLDKANGNANPDSNSKCTGYIDLSNYTIFLVSGHSQYATTLICTYDENKTFLRSYGDGTSAGQTFNDYEFTPQADEKFVRFSTYQYTQYPLKVVSLGEFLPINVKKQDNYLYNKKYVSCGDSFTAGDVISSDKVYPYLIAQRNNMKLVNMAHNGSYIHYGENGFTNPNNSYYYKNIPLDADIITIAYGLNETSTSIGTKESNNNTTIWGAYNEVLGWITTNIPNAKVGIISNDAWMTYELRNALQEIAYYWGVEFLDLKEYGKPFMISGKYSQDGDTNSSVVTQRTNQYCVSSSNGHPNELGHKVRSYIVENFLRGAYGVNNSYTKKEIDSELFKKADKSDTYTKQEVNQLTDGLSGEIDNHKKMWDNLVYSCEFTIDDSAKTMTISGNWAFTKYSFIVIDNIAVKTISYASLSLGNYCLVIRNNALEFVNFANAIQDGDMVLWIGFLDGTGDIRTDIYRCNNKVTNLALYCSDNIKIDTTNKNFVIPNSFLFWNSGYASITAQNISYASYLNATCVLVYRNGVFKVLLLQNIELFYNDVIVAVVWFRSDGFPMSKIYVVNEAPDKAITELPLSSKIFMRVGVIGDSYTSGWIKDNDNKNNPNYSWVKHMKQLTGNEWTNFGVSGSSTKSWVDGTLGQLPQVQTKGNKCQAYVIGLMINDQNTGASTYVPLGTSSDIGTNANSYYAYYYKLINALLSVNSSAIIFCNTCPRTDGDFPSYNQAVIDVVNYCQNESKKVYLVELRNYYWRNETFNNDALNGHYTAIGYEYMAEIYNKAFSDTINANASSLKEVNLIPYDSATDTYTKQEVNDKLNGYIKDNDTTYSATVRGKEVIVSAGAGYGSTTYKLNSIQTSNPSKPTCDYFFPDEKSGTLALTSDIPTVNNPTITFTQGGTTKGSITLNQSGDQTIEFDAGGSGSNLLEDIVDSNGNPRFINNHGIWASVPGMQGIKATWSLNGYNLMFEALGSFSTDISGNNNFTIISFNLPTWILNKISVQVADIVDMITFKIVGTSGDYTDIPLFVKKPTTDKISFMVIGSITPTEPQLFRMRYNIIIDDL